MRLEPPLDRALALQTVRDAYGIPASSLEFVPLGYESVCYRVPCADGAPYFLKLWQNTPRARATADLQRISLPLTRAMHDRGIYPLVPYPIPTRDGAHVTKFGVNTIALFPMLPGRTLPAERPVALRDTIARAIATIHRATPDLADVLPPRETFAIPADAALQRCLAAAACIGTDARPGLQALRSLVLPRQSEILAQLVRLHRLREFVLRLDGPLVLCHTDLHDHNMLVDDEGRLSLLDWDDAAVAPPEYDLWSMLGEGFARSLTIYAEAGGAQPLHLDRFAFYLLQRYVGDLVARFEALLEPAGSTEEDDVLLHDMEVFSFGLWRSLDDTLAGIAAALRESEC